MGQGFYDWLFETLEKGKYEKPIKIEFFCIYL